MKVLFVSYSVSTNKPGETSFMGVMKRCIRLLHQWQHSGMDLYLLNFGELPKDDPLVIQTLPHITIGHLKDNEATTLLQSLRQLAPDVIVLGEGPGNGKMLELSRFATRLNIPQICIENYYNQDQPAFFKKESPWLDQWLLLGIPLDNQFGRISEHAVLVPPLIRQADKVVENQKPVVTILGYDPNVVKLGFELMERLPRNKKVRLVYSRKIKPLLIDIKFRYPDLDIEYCTLPSEKQLSAYIAGSALVVCKSGFQQIVECLSLGTPVALYEAPGAVPEILLAKDFLPYAVYFPRNGAKWESILLKSAFWLMQRPKMPWMAEMQTIREPQKYAAECLRNMILELLKKKAPLQIEKP